MSIQTSDIKTESLAGYLARFKGSERPAVRSATLALSYAELLEMVDTTAGQLLASGIEPGDRILLMMQNSAEHIIGVLAINAIGAIAVPMDPESGKGRLLDIVQQTAPRSCLVGLDDTAPDGIQKIRLRIDPCTLSARCSTEGAAVEPVPITAPGRDVAFIRFTSGSTGHAKGVEITHAQQLWIARALCEYFRLDDTHRELLLVSMALSGGWQRVAATLYCGGCVIAAEKPLSVGDLLDGVVRHQATGFFTPPPLVRMLLASPADKVRSALRQCRCIEIGSAAIQSRELDDFIAQVPDARVYVHYGLTECSRAVVLDTARHPDRLDTVGTPLPGVKLRVVDNAGRDVSARQNGQILLRGPQRARGYWRQPELDRERFVDGWLATGDYGNVDEAGFLTLLGRHDDLINCGGHCYFPDEVEQALGTPAGIEQYLVAGVPDPRGVLQQVPWAFVVPVDTGEWTPADLLAAARQELPAFMVPRRVVVVPRLPLTASGKPDRRKTVQLFASDL